MTQPDIQSLSALESMKGISINPENITNALKKSGITLTISRVDTLEEALNRIVFGRDDYWIADRHVALHLIASMGLQEKIYISDISIGSAHGLFAMTQSTQQQLAMLDQVDKLIAHYHKTSYIDRLKVTVMKLWLSDKNCSQ